MSRWARGWIARSYWVAAAVLAALLWPPTSLADELRPAYLSFTETAPGQWRMVWRAPLGTGITPATKVAVPINCKAASAPSTEYGAAAVTLRQSFHCAGDLGGAQLGLTGFGAARTDALARVEPLGRAAQSFRLTPEAPTAIIAPRATRLGVARAYFLLGVDHILFGFDHLLFVIALVLLVDRFGRMVGAVTAFAAAHSVTLVGTTLGWMALPSAPVEAVIALSILFLAVEIVKRKPGEPRLSERKPWAVAFAFGLLHGFGFAGALADIGLPERDIPLALFTFNLGVEAGQIAVVAVAAAGLSLLRRWHDDYARTMIRLAAYAIGAVAAFWTIDRLFG
jgi:hydrogenase/urease accessory protein HupE